MDTGKRTYTHNGINIKYIDRGSGPTMVLIHGFGASFYSWREIINKFSENYRVIAIDLKGFGLSDKPEDSNYSVKEQSNIVKSIIKINDLKDIILVGHSFGGAVSLVTCLDLIETDNPIKKLILLDSASYEQSFPFFIEILRVPILNKMALAMLPDKMKARMILKKAFYDDSKIPEEVIDVYSGYLGHKGSHHALIMTSEQIIPKDIDSLTQRYKDINIPVLVIWGRMDEIISLSIGERLAKELPKANLQVIENCGHVPQEECPEKVIALLDGFLSQQ